MPLRENDPAGRATDVIVSIPFTLLRDVAIDVELHPPQRAAIDRLGYVTNAKAHGRLLRPRLAEYASDERQHTLGSAVPPRVGDEPRAVR